MSILLKKSTPTLYYQTTPSIDMGDHDDFSICIRFKASNDSVDGEPLLTLGTDLISIRGTSNANEYSVVLFDVSEVVLTTFTIPINTEIEVYIHIESASVARVYLDGVQSGSDYVLVGYDHSAYATANIRLTNSTAGSILIQKLFVWLDGTLPNTTDITDLATGVPHTDISVSPTHAYTFDDIAYGYAVILKDVVGAELTVTGEATTNQIVTKDPVANNGLLWRSTSNGNIYSSDGTTWFIVWQIRNFHIDNGYSLDTASAPLSIVANIVMDSVQIVESNTTRYSVSPDTAKLYSDVSFLDNVVYATGMTVDVPDNVVVKLDVSSNVTGNYFVTNELPFVIKISIPNGDAYFIKDINAVDADPLYIQQMLTNGGNLLHSDWDVVGTVDIINSAIPTRYTNEYYSLDYSAASYIEQTITVLPNTAYMLQMHVDKSVAATVSLGAKLTNVFNANAYIVSVEVDAGIGMVSNPVNIDAGHYGIEDGGDCWVVWMVIVTTSTISKMLVRPNISTLGSLGLIGDVIATRWISGISGPYQYNQSVMDTYSNIPAYEVGDIGANIYPLSNGGWTTDNNQRPNMDAMIDDTLVLGSTKYVDVLRDIIYIRNTGLVIDSISNVSGGTASITNEGRYLRVTSIGSTVLSVDVSLVDASTLHTNFTYRLLVSPIGRHYKVIEQSGSNSFATTFVRGDNILYDDLTALGGVVSISATGVVSIDYTNIDLDGITEDTFAFNINGELEETYTHTF